MEWRVWRSRPRPTDEGHPRLPGADWLSFTRSSAQALGGSSGSALRRPNPALSHPHVSDAAGTGQAGVCGDAAGMGAGRPGHDCGSNAAGPGSVSPGHPFERKVSALSHGGKGWGKDWGIFGGMRGHHIGKKRPEWGRLPLGEFPIANRQRDLDLHRWQRPYRQAFCGPSSPWQILRRSFRTAAIRQARSIFDGSISAQRTKHEFAAHNAIDRFQPAERSCSVLPDQSGRRFSPIAPRPCSLSASKAR